MSGVPFIQLQKFITFLEPDSAYFDNQSTQNQRCLINLHASYIGYTIWYFYMHNMRYMYCKFIHLLWVQRTYSSSHFLHSMGIQFYFSISLNPIFAYGGGEGSREIQYPCFHRYRWKTHPKKVLYLHVIYVGGGVLLRGNLFIS